MIRVFFMSIANKIRALMKLRGYKTKDLADAMGCTSPSISNKMSRDSFTAADLIKIATILDCDLSFTFPDGGKIRLTADDLEKGPH